MGGLGGPAGPGIRLRTAEKLTRNRRMQKEEKGRSSTKLAAFDGRDEVSAAAWCRLLEGRAIVWSCGPFATLALTPGTSETARGHQRGGVAVWGGTATDYSAGIPRCGRIRPLGSTYGLDSRVIFLNEQECRCSFAVDGAIYCLWDRAVQKTGWCVRPEIHG